MLFAVPVVAACADHSVEERLQSLTGTQYQALTAAEREAFVDDSVAFFSRVRRQRQDFLCESAVQKHVISDLYLKAAEAAGANPLAHAFSVISTEWCIELGEVYK